MNPHNRRRDAFAGFQFEPEMVAVKPEVQKRSAEASGNDIETVQAMINQFMGVRKQMQNLSQIMSAKEDLANLVGEDGLQNIKGLPSQQVQGAVGRKVAKGKVLRKKVKASGPARGFGGKKN